MMNVDEWVSGVYYRARTMSSILRMALTHSVANVKADEVTREG